MNFFQHTEFAEYLYKTFGFKEGTIVVYRAEAIGPGTEAYIFWYGPYASVGESVSSATEGKSGWFVLYRTDAGEAKDVLVTLATEWYGSEPLEVIGFEEEGEETFSALVKVERPLGYQEEL